MTFPISRFSAYEIEQVVDVISPDERLIRVKRQGNKKPYWLIGLTTVPLEYSRGLQLSAYLNSQLGSLNNFVLPNPQPSIVSRSGIYLSSTASVGATTIVLSGFTTNQANAVAAGDFMNVDGSAKAYQITENAPSDGQGSVSAKITPPLITSATSGSTINYGSNATFQVSLRNRLQTEQKVSNSKRLVFDIELIEQL